MAGKPESAASGSQEQALLLAAQRISAAKPAGGWACHIHLSRLSPTRMRDNFSFAVNMLRASVERFLGRIFLLENQDIVVICWQARLWQLRSAIASLKPLFESEGGGTVYQLGPDIKFCTWYDLDQQSEDFLRLAERLASREPDRIEEAARRAPAHYEPSEPSSSSIAETADLDAGLLARLLERLEQANLGGVIRRQSICRVLSGAPPHVVLEEIYVSIADLQRLFAPRVELLSDRWLFRHLTQLLDRRVLAWLAAADALSLVGDFSVNLNLATILSPDFARFEARSSQRLRDGMVIEFNKSDVLADLAFYETVREALRRRGYALCIDGLGASDLATIDCARLGADYYKVMWSPETPEDREGEIESAFRRLIAQAAERRIILCHCGSPEAVEFGQSLGLYLYQGWYVDEMLRNPQIQPMRAVAAT